MSAVRETDLAVLSRRMMAREESLVVENKAIAILSDMVMVQRAQWVVGIFALLGLGLGIRINEVCSRGYLPTQVKLKYSDIPLYEFLTVFRVGGDSRRNT